MRAALVQAVGVIACLILMSACGGDGGTEPTPTPQATGSVVGQVTAGSAVVSNAQVAISGGVSRSTTTDASGRYSFTSLAPGSYSLSITAPSGFDLAPSEAATKSATVTSGGTATINWSMQSRATGGPVVEIVMSGTSFSPQNVTVAPGTTVRWVNRDGSHTVTPDNTSQPGVWTGTGLLAPGQSFEYTFPTAGQTYNYHCQPHQAMGMTGSVRVQ